MDLSCYLPFEQNLSGDLGVLLNDGQATEITVMQPGPALLQVFRYSSGNATYGRLVRIEIEAPGAQSWGYNPLNPVDELRLQRELQQGRLLIRVRPGNVSGIVLPDLHGQTWSLSLLG